MKRLVVLLVLATLILVTLGASQIQKGSYTSAKQRKPSLPKKYLVEDGGYIKHRKTRGILSQYELRERHRAGRQLPGLRSGGYLYNRPVYTSSDHLAARPALPLTEVESHPLTNFPSHYTGELEEEPKDAKMKMAAEGDKPASADSMEKKTDGTVEEGKAKSAEKSAEAKAEKAEVSKQEVSQEKSDPVSVAVPASAVVPMTKTMPTDQDLDKAVESDAKGGSEPAVVVLQQETVSGAPPVAVN